MSKLEVMAIIPAYNESLKIKGVVLKTIPYASEICVIDDGSTDNTSEVLADLDITLIRHEQNKGKGIALKTGIQQFMKSSCDIAIFLDADGQHDPKDITKFVSLFKHQPELDVIVGTRFGTKEWQSNMPIPRKISNLLSRFGIWILYNGLVIEDPQNGYRAYKKHVLKYINFGGSRYEAETEMILDSYLKGFNIGKVQIQSVYEDDVTSHFSMLRDTWTIPGIMWKFFFKYKPFLFRTKEVRRKLRASLLEK